MCFWQNFYLSTLVPLLFCQMLHLTCLTVFWIRLCLDNCPVILTMTLLYVLHQTHSEFGHIYYCFILGIFRYIRSSSALLRDIHAYWVIFKAYSGIFNTMCNPRIFTTWQYWALKYLKHKTYLKSCEAVTRNIQNSVIVYYSAIFRHNPGIFRTLTQLNLDAYSELWHI